MHIAKPAQIYQGRALRRVARPQRLDHAARLQNLDRLFRLDAAHEGAAVLLADDQPFLLELRQHAADHAAIRVEEPAEIGLHQMLVGEVVALSDGGAELRGRIPGGIHRRHRAFSCRGAC